MGLFKNLYFDFGALNLLKRKKSPQSDNQEPVAELEKPVFNFNSPPTPEQYNLPEVSRRLLEQGTKDKDAVLELPKLAKRDVVQPPRIVQPEAAKPSTVMTNAQPETNTAPAEEVPEEEQGDVSLPVESQQTESSPEDIAREKSFAKDSFFSNLYSHITKEDSYIHSALPQNVMQKNLFKEMEEFWHNKKNDLHTAALSRAVKEDLLRKIEDLQRQEIEWQKIQLRHEKLNDELASKEILIDNSIRQLKRAFKRAHLNLYIKPENYFMLSDGSKLRNLQELLDSLRHMDTEVFNNHVTEGRNDFANWINDVMGLSDLAQNVRTAKTKAQMSDLIEKWYSFS